MAYQASRGTIDRKAERARADANNTKNVRNAADVAIASKNPYGVAAGVAVKGADKVTGGKASEVIGKTVTTINRISPMGNRVQKFSNKLSESGVSDKAGRAASFYNRARGTGKTPGETPNQVKNDKTAGGEQVEGSLPSSDGQNQVQVPPSSANGESSGQQKKGASGGARRKIPSISDFLGSREEKTSSSGGLSSLLGIVGIRKKIVMFALSMVPFLLILFLFIIIAFSVLGMFTNYEDAFGASEVANEEDANMNYVTNDNDQNAFFDRINDVKLRYQAQGKTLDAYKVAAVYAIIHDNNRKFEYNDMTDAVITSIADAMFDGNSYSDSVFKSNLSSNILPKYAPGESDYESMADDVIKYIEDYELLIGKEHESSINGRYDSCASTGSCTYDIKGYYISGKGNVSEALKVEDLYVRLMQCGVGNGHDYGGTFSKPLAGEALVPFEKYILGVAYQEIGPDAPAEAIKAQMVAARSYILGRHADMGDWRTLKKESGKWIIQVASCTQDQVYCDPDRGCSSNDGQWGQIHSGLSYDTGFSRQPMPKNSPLRTYATETAGEVLVNKDGYIIYTGYMQKEQDQFTALANKGLNYKQILLQVYNQGSKRYGANDILKTSCSNSSSTCSNSTLGYANWRQTDPAWANIQLGSSGYTIGQVGCNITSIAILIAKSGVPTNISDFNPGTFVQAMNKVGGFDSGGASQYYPVSEIAPSFKYENSVDVSSMSKQAKLNSLKNILAEGNNYVIAKVSGNDSQHWVAVDSVEGDTIKMIDPGSNATDMWSRYNWANTEMFVYFKVR